MNFLTSGYLRKHRNIYCFKIHCCRDNLQTSLNYNNKQVDNQQSKQSKCVLCVNGTLLRHNMIWTQVRYQNKECPKYPRLHRDVPLPNFDAYRKDEYVNLKRTTWGAGDGKPGFTYVVGAFGAIAAMYAIKSELTHFITYMSAAADVLALASIEVDLSNVVPGACVSYKWRGKPLFIKHRTDADIASEANTPMSELRDPQTPEQRTVKPEWLIVIGICTHLGCVPIPNSGDWAGGFYCPCHGSHYDNVGRTRKGPAPLNLEVPPYKFVSDTLVLVG